MSEHYLEREIRELFRDRPDVIAFLDQGSLDGLWYWDLDAPENEYMSPRFWQTLGFDPAQREHRASEWQDLIHPEDLKLAIENFEAHAENPEHPYDQLVRYRHADGSTVWVRCRGVAIRDETGKARRLLGAHTDVTELKRAQLALERANFELESFVHTASHELQQPARTVVSYLDLLRESLGGKLSEQERTFLNYAQSGAQRMQDRMLQLVRLARLAETPLNWERVSLASVVDELRDELAEAFEEDFVIDAEELPEVHGDRSLLTMALLNLVSNGLKFNKSEVPTVRISATCAARTARVSVRDNGIGIPPERQRDIFRAFRRLHHKDEFPGSGIGLALVRRALALHGSAIEVDSDGAGSHFSFRLAYAGAGSSDPPPHWQL